MNPAFDVVVIGSGPSGHKAAIAAAKAGKRVAIVEQERELGGACVSRGTIPSKTLRETALQLSRMRRAGGQLQVSLAQGTELASLMTRVQRVIDANAGTMLDQVRRNGIERLHGRAHFVSSHALQIEDVHGRSLTLDADVIVIAVGSSPRTPPGIPIDHEHVLDSDSVLSLLYLPESMTVLGSGVIACEYASIFAELGVRVTMIDKAERPLAFMDEELVMRFVAAFAALGGRFLGGRELEGVHWDGVSDVVTRVSDGDDVRAHKLLVALGRTPNLAGLALEAAGLAASARGQLRVNEHCQTEVPHIYAVGDVIGAPALAATAMEQGRRAIGHALGLPSIGRAEHVPIGIYTIPEMSSVGLSESEARARHGGALVGRARFDEVARGQISGDRDGLLKLVADASGTRLLGVQIVGDGATELVHLGQMALLADMPVETFINNIFNFPTLAEAYRVAALDLRHNRAR
jgi:NAD(P) transhydrogenase